VVRQGVSRNKADTSRFSLTVPKARQKMLVAWVQFRDFAFGRFIALPRPESGAHHKP